MKQCEGNHRGEEIRPLLIFYGREEKAENHKTQNAMTQNSNEKVPLPNIGNKFSVSEEIIPTHLIKAFLSSCFHDHCLRAEKVTKRDTCR
jgi:hypothetical protein